MKIDVTTIFFNSVIDGGTATAPWCVSIGQGKDKKINNDIVGLNEILDGLIYKSVADRRWVDTSAGSKNNEYLLVSKFDKIFINGVQQESLSIIGLLVREHTKSMREDYAFHFLLMHHSTIATKSSQTKKHIKPYRIYWAVVILMEPVDVGL